MTRPARMRDVAALAGVGTMTVSRVINGSAPVTEETRKRVFDAIETLRYRPNQIARSLREQRSRQIGIILPNLQDSFFATCAEAVSLVAKEHGYSVNIAMSYEDPEIEFSEAMMMLLRLVDGLIVIPVSGFKSRLTEPEFAAIQIVTLDRPVGKNRFDSVVVQNRNGARLAVQHLIDHGHRRIAYLGLGTDLSTLGARQDGYRQTMTRSNLQPQVILATYSLAETSESVRSVMSQPDAPTAFFCSNGLTTRHALHALSQMGLSVPEAVALVGFDDFETADLLKPAVTVVRQPTTDMARIGAKMLFARLGAEGAPIQVKTAVLPVELVVRQSCGTHPARK